MDLHLPSGLIVKRADEVLREKFRQWPWDRYDGVAVESPHVVSSNDVDAVYRLGMRGGRSSYATLLRTQGATLTRLLRRIPLNVMLEEADLTSLRRPMVDLFNAARAPRLLLAGSTKLLYRFRPGLFVVLDSVVANYYWYATSISDEPRFRQLERAKAKSLGDYVFDLMQLLQWDVLGARAAIDRVSRACSDEVFAGAPRVRIVESLIWFYYARGARERASTAE